MSDHKHGIWSSDCCENCIDEHLTRVLAGAALDAEGG